MGPFRFTPTSGASLSDRKGRDDMLVLRYGSAYKLSSSWSHIMIPSTWASTCVLCLCGRRMRCPTRILSGNICSRKPPDYAKWMVCWIVFQPAMIMAGACIPPWLMVYAEFLCEFNAMYGGQAWALLSRPISVRTFAQDIPTGIAAVE